MIFKRRSSEERFAEELAREMERQVKEAFKRLSPEQRREYELMEKRSPAVRLIDERIKRGEIKLLWRRTPDGEVYITHRETFKNFPFMRHGDYMLLPSGIDDYFHINYPMSYDWVLENTETWRPRLLATIEPLQDYVEDWAYTGLAKLYYTCRVAARDGRLFLADLFTCWLMEEIDGRRTAQKIAARVAARYSRHLWRTKLKPMVERGELSKEEAQKILDELVIDALIGLAILKDLGLVA